MPDTVYVWRHPRPIGAAGRCIGRTDLPVDPRRAKRLARRIQRFARQHGLPRQVVTSPQPRCRAVGRWLRRWGWRHRVDPALREFDFGRWDGRLWSDVPRAEIDAWCDAFASGRPGGGERVEELLARVAGFDAGTARVVVGHGGWLAAAQWRAVAPGGEPTAARWPAAPGYGRCVEVSQRAR